MDGACLNSGNTRMLVLQKSGIRQAEWQCEVGPLEGIFFVENSSLKGWASVSFKLDLNVTFTRVSYPYFFFFWTELPVLAVSFCFFFVCARPWKAYLNISFSPSFDLLLCWQRASKNSKWNPHECWKLEIRATIYIAQLSKQNTVTDFNWLTSERDCAEHANKTVHFVYHFTLLYCRLCLFGGKIFLVLPIFRCSFITLFIFHFTSKMFIQKNKSQNHPVYSYVSATELNYKITFR